MIYHCYQCDRVAHLFADSRCSTCTMVNPETGRLDPEPEDDEPDTNVLGIVWYLTQSKERK